PAASPGASAPVASSPETYGGLLANERNLEAMGLGGDHVGSNNWVIAGARTASGKPILANDPHLGSRIPSIWYLAHISGGAIDAIGATLPGIPGIVIGHNARIAWGVTNTGPDVQDLFVERLNERNEALYQGRWEPITVISETIKVKGEEDVPLFVRVTRHGPLISDVTEGTGEPLAFRWTALDPKDSTLEGFLGVNRAQSWAEFTEALSSFHAPMQNFVYADVDDNIGYYAPGALPIRASGDGTSPAEGWSGLQDWRGYVPFAELPHDFNPERGYIVSANNQAVPASYPYLISTNWAPPYRAQRIVELVEAQSDHTVDSVAALQADVVSLQARSLLPYMTAISPAGEQAQAALELLRGWDGTMAGDSAAAAVYAAYYHALPEAIFGDELREGFSEDYTDSTSYHAMVLPEVLGGAANAWCDNVNTPAGEGCDAALAKALEQGLKHMAEAQGTPDVRSWRWDKAHRVIFPHNPFDSAEALRPYFSRSAPNGGDGFTVNVAPSRRSELYLQYHIPSYRHIIDMADLDGSRFMQSTGQSGNPLSGSYDNLIAPWQRVEHLPMRFSQAAVDAAQADMLTLTP
ncbi:MAG: penicillin acylase family protein, partial [Chloroflexales bacterium]|nr:penicillin acylase family protein [Chloroflexales bacterium]